MRAGQSERIRYNNMRCRKRASTQATGSSIDDFAQSMSHATLKISTALLCLALSACGGGSPDTATPATDSSNNLAAAPTDIPAPSDRRATPPAAPAPPALAAPSVSTVTAPPPSLGLDPYYEKYLDASGIAVVAAAEVDDRALLKAKQIIETMLAKRPDIRASLEAAASRFLIIPKDKGITTLPDYRSLKDAQAPDGFADWDSRARGLGGWLVMSCGEENLLKLPGDRYAGQSICVHEFAHTMQIGLAQGAPGFNQQVIDHYDAIRQSDFIVNTYMVQNYGEYWATAVQAWYNAGFCKAVPDGIYGPLCDRTSLAQLDPVGYQLISRVFEPPPVAALY